MSSWTDVHAYLAEDYELAGDDPDSVSLVFEWEGEERSQGLIVSTYSEPDEVAWMQISSVVCAESQLEPRAALEKNGELAFGALSLVSGDYMLSYAVPLALIADTTVIDQLLSLVAAAADELENEIAGTDEH